MSRVTDLMRWPLWSWRNLTMTGGALILVLTGVGRVAGPPSAAPDPVTPPAATTATAEGPTPTRTASPRDPATPRRQATTPRMSVTPASVAGRGEAADTQPVAAAAVAFVRAWARPGLPPETWWRGIRPLSSPELTKALRGTDPNRVPATTVTGPARDIHVHGHRAEATVSTDGGRVSVRLQRVAQHWLVVDIEPAGPPPGAPTPDLHSSGGSSRGG